MRHPHHPPVQLDCRGMSAQAAAELTAKAQKERNAYYKGVEWEVVTDNKGHSCKLYVDGNEVMRGLAGLSDAMREVA